MVRLQIKALDKGPCLVRHPAVITDADGGQSCMERKTIALCRSGGSTTEPFCDGTHSKIGFWPAEWAVGEEAGQGR